jgi:hypothetical protein
MTTAKLPEAPIPDTHVGILETALLATVSTISHKDGYATARATNWQIWSFPVVNPRPLGRYAAELLAGPIHWAGSA